MTQDYQWLTSKQVQVDLHRYRQQCQLAADAQDPEEFERRE